VAVIDLVLVPREEEPDILAVTLISIIERRNAASQSSCDHCDQTAWVSTGDGLRCETHAIAEVRSAMDEGKGDWVPRILRSRRTGAHTA
jgi:hypothetical protein